MNNRKNGQRSIGVSKRFRVSGGQCTYFHSIKPCPSASRPKKNAPVAKKNWLMDISRCLFPRERASGALRCSWSCSRRACPIYMECSRKVRLRSFDARSNYFYWPFSPLFSAWFRSVGSLIDLSPLPLYRKYFLGLQIPRRVRDANNFIPLGFRGMLVETFVRGVAREIV